MAAGNCRAWEKGAMLSWNEELREQLRLCLSREGDKAQHPKPRSPNRSRAGPGRVLDKHGADEEKPAWNCP